MKRSGLQSTQLFSIWKLAAREDPSHTINKEEFYCALRLIAYAQNGIQVCEDSIKFNIDVALPKFE